MVKTVLVIFFAYAALAGVLCADGVYQKTRDGKTTVWNAEPKPGDEASWDGGRDSDDYAKGFGTLTWYSVPGSGGSSKAVLFARYFGRMERGKFSGPVNVHTKQETHHAIFDDGEKITRWTRGAAPYRAFSEAGALLAKAEREAEAPAEGPVKAQKSEQSAAKPPKEEERPEPRHDVAAVATKAELPREPARPKTPDPSLQLLTGPPSSLRHDLPPPAAGTNEARLTSEEVAEAGNAAVRTHGYDLNEFSRGEPQFDSENATWTVLYSPTNSPDPEMKGFTVTIDDATRGTVFVPAK